VKIGRGTHSITKGILLWNIPYTKPELTGDNYITADWKHSELLIIDVQRDFTLAGAVAEIPGTLQSMQ
jgi:hypothetical protein